MAGEDSRSVVSPASPRRPVTRGSEVSTYEPNQTESPRAENETNGFEFVDWGPPPDLRKRELIFDAMSKIITTKPAADQQDRATGDNRGTHVFTWGAGYHGQLGLKFSRGMRKYSAIPRVIELNVVVRQIVCGALHTVVLTEAGTVYTWGDGRNAQLGHSSDTLTMQPSPVLVDSLGSAFVVQIACGRTHTLCLTDRGVMYSWGWNKYGQTGHGDRQVVKLPKAIDSSSTGKDVCFIDCGDKHSIAINKQGQVFSFGSNEHGQIGQGQVQDVLKPTRILESLENKFVKSSSSGTTHTAFLTGDGEVYVCGFGEHLFPTESNRNVHSQFYTTPKHIPTPEPIKQVASGQGHILALSEQGNVFAWGNGEYGQLGHGARAHCNTPRLVLQGKDVHQVAAGRYHSTALTAFGTAYSWGCGENGQLGHDNDESVSIPRVINAIVGAVVGQISCGEHHTAALTSAPWAKLSADMVDWLRRNQAEYDITQQFLKRVMRGLTNKDHARITAEVNKWQSEHDAKREELAKEEADEIKRDYEAVQSRQALQSDVVLGMLARQSARMVTTDDIQSMLPGAGGPVERSISRRQSIDESTAEALAAFDNTEDEESKSGSTTALIPHPSAAKLQKKGKKNDTLAALLSPRAGDLDLGSTELITSLSPNGVGGGELTIQTARDAAGKEMGGRNKKAAKGATVSLPDVFSPRDRKIDAGQSTALVPQPYVRSHFLKETAHAMKKMHKLVTEKGSSETQAELIRLQQLVIQLRKEYDNLHVCVGGMRKQFEALQREYDMLANGSGFQDRNAQKDVERLHELEMQLDSVNIKITETEENQKHYELNIWHLREEEREHVQQLEDIRRQCNDINLTFKRMSDLKQSACEEKEKAEAELVEFKTEIVEYRRFIANQLKSIQDVLDMSSRSAAEAAKEEHESARKEKSLALISAKLNSLSEEARQKEHQAKLLSEELLELDEKLKYHQGRFQQLANATGLTDPDAIVNKFFFKGEINQQLQTEIEEKQRLIEQLRGKQEDLREELNNSKTGFKDKRWRDVDTLQDQYRLAAARVQKTQTNVERSERKIVFVQEGLTNILRSLEKAQQLANDSASECGTSPIPTTIVEEGEDKQHLESTQSTEKSDALSHSGSEEALNSCLSKSVAVPGAYQGFSASLDSSQMWQDKECFEVFDRLVSAMNWLEEMTKHPPTRQPKSSTSVGAFTAPASASPKHSPSQDSVLASKQTNGALAAPKPSKRAARKTGVAADTSAESQLKPVPPPRSSQANRNTSRRRTNVPTKA